MTKDRKLPGDWYPACVPDNVVMDDTAYIETSFSFYFYRSQLPTGMEVGPGASSSRNHRGELACEDQA